jgi:hypothetical protein
MMFMGISSHRWKLGWQLCQRFLFASVDPHFS